MIVFILTLGRLIWGIRKGLQDPEFRVLLFLAGTLLVSGSVFYTMAEGWSILDSAYFSLITLTTVGYGDLAPSTPASKIFTMVYIVVGIGVILGFVSKLAGNVQAGKGTFGELLRRTRGGSRGKHPPPE